MSSSVDGKPVDEKEFVSAIARAFAVLEAFDQDHVSMTLSAVAARTGLSPATVRRCLYTLGVLGYIRQNGRQFTLGARLLALSSSYLRSNQIEEFIVPELQQLVDVFGDAASVAVLDDGAVFYLAHVSRQNAVRPAASVGVRYPAHATSLGKVLLAFASADTQNRYLARAPFERLTDRTITTGTDLVQALKLAKRDGYALAIDELDYGIASLAVPIMDATGTVVAAINSSGYSGRQTAQMLVENRLAQLQQCARNISSKLARYPNLVQSALQPPRL
jgi:IclR family transcriptional regulator, pca regulon regulatory protein